MRVLTRPLCSICPVLAHPCCPCMVVWEAGRCAGDYRLCCVWGASSAGACLAGRAGGLQLTRFGDRAAGITSVKRSCDCAHPPCVCERELYVLAPRPTLRVLVFCPPTATADDTFCAFDLHLPDPLGEEGGRGEEKVAEHAREMRQRRRVETNFKPLVVLAG